MIRHSANKQDVKSSALMHMVSNNLQTDKLFMIRWLWNLLCNKTTQYAISQLRFVRSSLHLVTYLDVGNFSDKSTEKTLHEICVQVFLRFSDSSKPDQSVSLIDEYVWVAGFRKSKENLLKTSWKVVPVIEVAHIFWWRHGNRKQSASEREHWCDVSCDIPYYQHNYAASWMTI